MSKCRCGVYIFIHDGGGYTSPGAPAPPPAPVPPSASSSASPISASSVSPVALTSPAASPSAVPASPASPTPASSASSSSALSSGSIPAAMRLRRPICVSHSRSVLRCASSSVLLLRPCSSPSFQAPPTTHPDGVLGLAQHLELLLNLISPRTMLT